MFEIAYVRRYSLMGKKEITLLSLIPAVHSPGSALPPPERFSPCVFCWVPEHSHECVFVFCLTVEESHPSLPRVDPPSGEEEPAAPLDLEGEAGASVRPPLSSGYSKQFQKTLPPRFLRQQVACPTGVSVWCVLEGDLGGNLGGMEIDPTNRNCSCAISKDPS